MHYKLTKLATFNVQMVPLHLLSMIQPVHGIQLRLWPTWWLLLHAASFSALWILCPVKNAPNHRITILVEQSACIIWDLYRLNWSLIIQHNYASKGKIHIIAQKMMMMNVSYYPKLFANCTANLEYTGKTFRNMKFCVIITAKFFKLQ